MGNFFAYTRVSTPRQGVKGVSLQEQKDAIERYAAIHGLQITRWFEERESASQTGRFVFNQMLRLLRLGKVDGVVMHKIDRSMRNLEDWAGVGKLVDSGVRIHFASENVDLKTVGGRLSADIQAVVAAHYSRNLREEVKKGLYGRLKQGFYPFRAPIGYLDQGSGKAKIPDPVRAPLIREAFELYGSGRFSLPDLALEMFRRGLRNLNGGPVTINSLVTILKNPFYAGIMRITKTGVVFERGNHEPLIRTSTFDTAQAVLAGKRVDRLKNHIFTYSRIARCETCNYSLIGERQKGHTYYRCHGRPFKNPAVCPSTSVREEQLDEVVLRKLAQVDLSEHEVAIGRKLLETRKEELRQGQSTRASALMLQLENGRTRLAKLTDLLLDGTIDESTYTARRNANVLEQTKIKEQLTEIERGSCGALDLLEKTVELAKSPSTLYKTASCEKKRELLKIVLSNLSVSGKNVEITLAIPFLLIANREKSSDGQPYRGTCRTWEVLIENLLKHFTSAKAPATS